MTVKGPEIFEKIRTTAQSFSEFMLSVKLLTIVACFTKDQKDIDSLMKKVNEHGGNRPVAAEALAVMVRILSQAGLFEEARLIVGNRKRGIVSKMIGMDSYWHAQAGVGLASYSREPDDIHEAKELINSIHNTELRKEARIDLEVAFSEGGRSLPKRSSFNPYLKLASVVSQLERFSVKQAQSGVNSAYLHLVLNAIIENLFADAFK